MTNEFIKSTEFIAECMQDRTKWDIYNIASDLKVEELMAMNPPTPITMQQISLYAPKIAKMKEAFDIESFWSSSMEELVHSLMTDPEKAKQIYKS